MKSIERITHEPHDRDAWICICGNMPHDDGFYPCDEHGDEVDPDNRWHGLHVCDRCGRIIDQETLEVIAKVTR